MHYKRCYHPQLGRIFGKVILYVVLPLVFIWLLYCIDYRYYPLILFNLLTIIIFDYHLIEKLFYNVFSPYFLSPLSVTKAKIYYKIDESMGYSQKEYLEDEKIKKEAKTALYVVIQHSYNDNKSDKEFCKKYNDVFHLLYKKYSYIYNIKNDNFMFRYFTPTIYIVPIYFLFLFLTATSLGTCYELFPSIQKIFFLLLAQFLLVIVVMILGRTWFRLIMDDSHYSSEIEKIVKTKILKRNQELIDFQHGFLIDFLYEGKYFKEKRKEYFKPSLNYKKEKDKITNFIPALVATFVLVFSFNVLHYQSDYISDKLDTSIKNQQNKDSNASCNNK